MGIRKYNPTSPGVRGMTVSTFEEITTATPEKSLTTTLKKNAGRNFRGKITVRHRGGGARRKYRIIDFKRNKDGVPGKVSTTTLTVKKGKKTDSYPLATTGAEIGRASCRERV